MRAWLTACYGERFLVPQRWLIVTTCYDTVQLREVDGIERVDDTQAFVYEIKHRTPGYAQLAEEYVPLLRLAYPSGSLPPSRSTRRIRIAGIPRRRRSPSARCGPSMSG